VEEGEKKKSFTVFLLVAFFSQSMQIWSVANLNEESHLKGTAVFNN